MYRSYLLLGGSIFMCASVRMPYLAMRPSVRIPLGWAAMLYVITLWRV